ncbi:tropomodulin-3-like isoform X1 [Anneissia japonica]|uniref:tropomodulin-3-like isoform X1 n=1 Tax=Anneissia japonica TaxID=1529436 RepID=UPI001425A956|nr:tropomodulin-3-like isoform X1 [Anneissia japonica]XP_033099969.1 tropomodulin-3-like isoform X1 [Anneissia japonica]
MTTAQGFSLYKDLDKYKDVDIDDLLENLTEAEVLELESMLDPDNALLPASDRMRNQTDKEPTGPFDRQKLQEFLENQAKSEKDVEDRVPYKSGQKRGKVWKAKANADMKKNGNANADEIEVQGDAEMEEALKDATEEDLVELAGILGLHSMLNQDQYYAANVHTQAVELNENLRELVAGPGSLQDEGAKFSGISKCFVPKALNLEPENNLDVDKALKQVQENDPELTSLNMNNIKNIPIPTLISLSEALHKNTHLKTLSMASTRLNDRIAKALGEAIEANTALTCLNLESNFITGTGILAIMKALLNNETLSELRIANQRSSLGVKVESYVAEVLGKNKTIVKFGLAFDHAGPRAKANNFLMRNNEIVRKKRVNNGVENQ